MDRESVESVLGCKVEANWLETPRGSSPARIRQIVLSELAETCPAVVLVDSDDLLSPSRVAAARVLIANCELGGCALQLVDRQGNDLNIMFDLPRELDPVDVFPRWNVFGFSNSVFETKLLRRCLPIPEAAVLVDWYLATRAWLLGGKLGFDHVPHMKYRQYSGNMAHIRLPFCQEHVLAHTELVRKHFMLVLSEPLADYRKDRYAALLMVQADVEEFWSTIVRDGAKLQDYVDALNALAPKPIWWSCVAHPSLGHLWRS